jgi:hypothetical protein
LAVRANNPTAAHGLSARLHAVSIERGHRFSPANHNAGCLRMFHQQLMQYGAADTQAVGSGKTGFGREFALDEPDPVKRKSRVAADSDTQIAQRRDTVGHYPFAAGLLARRLRAVGEHDLEAAPARRDRGGKPGGTTANDENLGRVG